MMAGAEQLLPPLRVPAHPANAHARCAEALFPPKGGHVPGPLLPVPHRGAAVPSVPDTALQELPCHTPLALSFPNCPPAPL